MKIEKISDNQIPAVSYQRKIWTATEDPYQRACLAQIKPEAFREMMQQAQIEFGFES